MKKFSQDGKFPSESLLVDEKRIAFNPAYDLPFLKTEEQRMMLETMDYEQVAPSLRPSA